MILDFIENYAKLIVNFPEDIVVSSKQIEEGFVEVTIQANSIDTGKLIGKNGNMINALKTMLNGCKAKDGISYRIQVLTK